MDLQQKAYPLEIKDVEPGLDKELMKYFTGEHTGFVRVGPKGYLMTRKYRQEAANIYHMSLRPDDIFVSGYPRSGTTWTQELVWMVANDLDYAKSDAIPLFKRYPFLEVSTLMHPIMMDRVIKENSHSPAVKLELENIKIRMEETVEQRLSRFPSPRFIKTHLPLSLLPPALLDTAKMVYVARDPRDVVVSFYHFNRFWKPHGYVGDFKTYWNYFVRDLIYWTPYFEHLKEHWEQRDHPNMLFLFYEEINKDLPMAVRRVAKFLNKEFSSEQIAKLCDHLSFDNLKNNKSVNHDNVLELVFNVPGEQGFIRKGKAGGWRDYFDEEMRAQAEQWMARNLSDTDLRFPHIL